MKFVTIKKSVEMIEFSDKEIKILYAMSRLNSTIPDLVISKTPKFMNENSITRKDIVEFLNQIHTGVPPRRQ